MVTNRNTEQQRYVTNAFYRQLVKCPHADLVDLCARRDIENPSLNQRVVDIQHAGKPG